MAVVTLSRQYGSGGDEIASRVCKSLGYRYFDKSLMVQVTSEMGLSESEIVDFWEDTYKARGFLKRLFSRGSRVLGESGTRTRDTTGAKAVLVKALDEEWRVSMVKGAIEAAYEQGDVVILGRGGQAILQDKPNVLHVRIKAPLNARVTRVRYEEPSGLTHQFEREAAREKINERERAAEEYLRRFHGIDWTDPRLYHLVIDTEKWSIDPAARLIVQALECLPKKG